MALDIPALAANGIALALSVAGTAASNVVLYTSPIRGTYNAITDTTPITWTETSGKAFVFDVERKNVDPGNQEEYSAWVSGRLKSVLLPAATFPEPMVNDKLVIVSETCAIIRVETIPAGYLLTVRR